MSPGRRLESQDQTSLRGQNFILIATVEEMAREIKELKDVCDTLEGTIRDLRQEIYGDAPMSLIDEMRACIRSEIEGEKQ